MEKLLTIIIPTYNMEAYLAKCLDSLILPDTWMQLLEILVVNDGSKDSSSEIAHRYAERYPETFIVIDKENGNYGSCINAGMQVATGKYVRVLDSDDSYDNASFQTFLQHLATLDIDMVVTQYKTVDEQDQVLTVKTYPIEAEKEMKLDDYRGDLLFMPAITYKRALFQDLNYHQTEGVSYTDNEWMCIPLLRVRSFISLNCCIYKYFLGREGQTMNAKTYALRAHQLLVVYQNILAKIKTERPGNMIYLNRFIMETLTNVYKTILTYGSKEQISQLSAFDARLKQNHPAIYEQLGNSTLESLSYKFIRHWRQHKYLSRMACSALRWYHQLLHAK